MHLSSAKIFIWTNIKITVIPVLTTFRVMALGKVKGRDFISLKFQGSVACNVAVTDL